MSFDIDAGPEAASGAPADVCSRTMPRRAVAFLSLLLVCVGIWTYRNSLDGDGIFDDDPNVGAAVDMYKNPSPKLLLPRPRSLAYLTFALNYKFDSGRVRSFHQVNRAIHILAALVLFGVAGRTLRLPSLGGRYDDEAADRIAFCIALIWLVHPLQTQAVTYMVQRIESSMGLFYLLCLYCLIRGATAQRAWPWYVLDVLLFFLGIGTKEVIGTAPLLMLLFDRIFLAGSWREVIRRRGWFYGLLLGPMILFGLYMAPYFNTKWSHDMGLGHPWITPWMYARTQTAVILHYLRLAYWPDKLCLDYCWPVMPVRELVVPMAVISALLALTLWALRYRSRVGFLAAGFFLILAPTSSFMPINDLAVEHRMYLPLACVVSLTVLAAYAACERFAVRAGWSRGIAPKILIATSIVIAFPLALRTVARNRDYRNSLAMWQSAVAAYPMSHRATNNLAVSLWEAQRKQEAREYFRRAFDMECIRSANRGGYLDSYGGLKWVLNALGKPNDIFPILSEGVARHPNLVHYHWFLGDELLGAGDSTRAVAELREAVRIDPGFNAANVMLATALFLEDRPRDAIEHLRALVRREPKDTAAANYLAWVLATHPDPTVRNGHEAVRLSEDVCLARNAKDAKSWGTLAAAYAESGRFDDAVKACQTSISLAHVKTLKASESPEPLHRQMSCYSERRPYRIKVEELAVHRSPGGPAARSTKKGTTIRTSLEAAGTPNGVRICIL
ncbi:MAG: tetratricopeptide repeat protein [Isosphaeraceae bacterium]|nr:tetratricopeptide repeat protein [Isosphaeraceae bacterium]